MWAELHVPCKLLAPAPWNMLGPEEHIFSCQPPTLDSSQRLYAGFADQVCFSPSTSSSRFADITTSASGDRCATVGPSTTSVSHGACSANAAGAPSFSGEQLASHLGNYLGMLRLHD